MVRFVRSRLSRGQKGEGREADAGSVPRRPDPLGGLAAEAAKGDAAATRRLLGLLAPSLLGVARVVLGRGHPDVEDATQETLLAVVHALPSFRGQCGVLHFACRIGVRTAMAVRRRAQADETRLAELARATEAAEGTASTPHEDAVAIRRQRFLRHLLDELPEPQAESLALRILLGCSMREVAAATDAPVNTVRSRLRLAKEAIARRIEEDPVLAKTLEDLR